MTISLKRENWGTSWSWRQSLESNRKNTPGTTSHGNEPFFEFNRTLILRCQRNWKRENDNNCSQDLSRTNNRILGPLSKLNELLPNPPILVQSGTASETSQTLTEEINNQTRIVSRMIFILEKVVRSIAAINFWIWTQMRNYEESFPPEKVKHDIAF